MVKIPLGVTKKEEKCISSNAKVTNSNILDGYKLNSFILKREIPRIRKVVIFSIFVQISKKLSEVRIRPKNCLNN